VRIRPPSPPCEARSSVKHPELRSSFRPPLHRGKKGGARDAGGRERDDSREKGFWEWAVPEEEPSNLAPREGRERSRALSLKASVRPTVSEARSPHLHSSGRAKSSRQAGHQKRRPNRHPHSLSVAKILPEPPKTKPLPPHATSRTFPPLTPPHPHTTPPSPTPHRPRKIWRTKTHRDREWET
jgi:hypothetical protein